MTNKKTFCRNLGDFRAAAVSHREAQSLYRLLFWVVGYDAPVFPSGRLPHFARNDKAVQVYGGEPPRARILG